VKISIFEAAGKCLYWSEKKILIAGDLHLGYEDYLNERGWSFPRTQMEKTLNDFKKVFSVVGKVKKIILLGDIKHYFAGVLSHEWGDVGRLLIFFEKYLYKNGKIIIIKGNHDNILEPIIGGINKKKIKLVDFYIENDVLFVHRDFDDVIKNKKYGNKIGFVVLAHYHPAVVISDGYKKERYKCFLFGKKKFGKKMMKMIILPSFFPLIEGSDVGSGILEGKLDVSKFKVYAIGDKVYDFGRVRNLRMRGEKFENEKLESCE